MSSHSCEVVNWVKATGNVFSFSSLVGNVSRGSFSLVAGKNLGGSHVPGFPFPSLAIAAFGSLPSNGR